MRITNWLVLFCVLTVVACTSENPSPDPEILGYQYYPLNINDYRTYQVQHIEYKLSKDHDTIDYQLMEVVADTFQNLEGGLSYRLERFKRENASMEWEIDSVWSVQLNKYTAVQVENNVPLIKLSFPVEENKSWNVNALNAKAEKEYLMSGVNSTFSANDTSIFDHTLTVIQDEITDNILFRSIAKEVFQEDIGLVYKEKILINYCADVECLGQEEIESGFNYKQILIANGQE